MNQIKIGKFIAKCRKEKGFTQQELADKLGVTDKAISKWENGRCLMDISLLKPLSECLDISIVELINGEKVENDEISKKSGEAVEKTLSYAKKKIEKNKIKTIFVVCLLCIVMVFFAYKGALLYFYNISSEQRDNLQNAVKGLKFNDSVSIYKRTIPDEEYLVLDNIKIKNSFSEFEKAEDIYGVNVHQFILRDDNGETLGAVSIGINIIGTLVNNFVRDDLIFMGEISSSSVDIGQFNNADRKDFLLQNDINNDVDFLKYISENCYAKNNIFTSPKKMKENYAINLFASIVVPEVDSVTLIDGDYFGYIYNIERNNKKIREVHILRDNKDYSFMFLGENFTTDEYISDLLSTLEIK